MASPKRIVVTGGSGFIGANLVRRLVAGGHDVHLLVRPTWSDWRLRDLRDQVTVHAMDIADALRVGRTMLSIRPKWVFHLAAHGAHAFQTDVDAIARTNNLGTASIVTASVDARVEVLVNAGTAFEYGQVAETRSEDDPAAPVGHFGVTKAAATELCRHAARAHGIPMPTLRVFSAYGPWEDPRRLIPTLVAHALEKRWPLLGAPEMRRDFIYVDDVVDAFLAVAQQPPDDPAAVYNVGCGRGTSLLELVATIADLFDVDEPPAWSKVPLRSAEAEACVANPAKISQEFGWRPKTSLRDGLKATAAWLQAERQLLAS